MWSIGNEVEQRADEPEGDLISKRLVNTVRKYDTSRFTTIGSNDFWDRRQFSWDKDSYRIFKNLDVAGYNYIWWKYESDHAAYPDRVIYGSESYPKEAAQNWNLVEKHPYVIGDFVWTAIDYLGEAGLAHALYLKEGEILTFVATRSLNLIIVMCCGASVPLLWQSMPLFPKARKKW